MVATFFVVLFAGRCENNDLPVLRNTYMVGLDSIFLV